MSEQTRIIGIRFTEDQLRAILYMLSIGEEYVAERVEEGGPESSVKAAKKLLADSAAARHEIVLATR